MNTYTYTLNLTFVPNIGPPLIQVRTIDADSPESALELIQQNLPRTTLTMTVDGLNLTIDAVRDI